MSNRPEFPLHSPDPNWNWPSGWLIFKRSKSVLIFLAWSYIFGALLFSIFANIVLIVRSEVFQWLTFKNFSATFPNKIERDFHFLAEPLYWMMGVFPFIEYFPIFLTFFVLLVIFLFFWMITEISISTIEKIFNVSN